jgi:hypothetical protein
LPSLRLGVFFRRMAGNVFFFRLRRRLTVCAPGEFFWLSLSGLTM